MSGVTSRGNGDRDRDRDDENDGVREDSNDSTTLTLSVEIPVGDRKVAIRYPRDLTPDESKKVANVTWGDRVPGVQ